MKLDVRLKLRRMEAAEKHLARAYEQLCAAGQLTIGNAASHLAADVREERRRLERDQISREREQRERE